MAVTVEKTIEYKAFGEPVMFPVKSGVTIYKGALACIDDTGYLDNLTSSNYNKARLVCIPKDDTANITGPAATTSAGSIGTGEEKSSAAGDKTVRLCHTQARVLLTFTAIAQSDVGKTVYASDNYTCDETQIAGVKIGTLVMYISATSGWVELNTFYQKDGTCIARGNLTAVTSTAVGGVFSWANPTGEAILVRNLILDVTTVSTATATIDAGVSANSTTGSDTLIDGCDLNPATGVFHALDETYQGTNGHGFRKCASTGYVLGTASATMAGLVGTFAIEYQIWE